MKINSAQKNEIYIGVAAFLAYLISIANDFHTDDWSVLALMKEGHFWNNLLWMDNPGYLRPLTNIVLYIRYALFGAYPPPYYILQIILHGAVCILFYRFLIKFEFARGQAMTSALIFAIYFQHYEAVLWLYGIGRLLAAIIWIISLSMLKDYLGNSNWRSYFTFAIVSALGFFIVEDYIISIIVFAAFVWLMGEGKNRSKMTSYIIFAGVTAALIYFGLRDLFIEQASIFNQLYYPGLHIISNLRDYLGWLILPSPDHAYFSGITLKMGPLVYFVWKMAAVFSILAVIAIALYLLFKAPNNIRFLVVFTLVTLLPALPFVTKVASRYLYIPSLGFAAIAGYYLHILLQKTNNRPFFRKTILTLASLILAFHVIAIQFASLEYRKTQKMVRGMVTDVKGSGVNLDRYQYVLLDHLPGRAAPGPALWYNFGYNDIIASNDAIAGPYDICKAALRLRTEGKSFVVFDYENGHLQEKTAAYLSDCADSK